MPQSTILALLSALSVLGLSLESASAIACEQSVANMHSATQAIAPTSPANSSAPAEESAPAEPTPAEIDPTVALATATAYTDQGQYEQAIMLASQIPDRALMPLPEYADPKIELLYRIVAETSRQGKFALAEQAAQVITEPADQVNAWIAIAQAYQAAQQLPQATATLDKALAIANTIDIQVEVFQSRPEYFSSARSNADLLVAIAQGYWAAGQREQAIATVQSAIQSIQAFQLEQSRSETPPTTLLEETLLADIAQLGRDWQVIELQQAAVETIEAIDEAPEKMPTPMTTR
jgi:tetratricopeptide (TPR) repeat protein